MIAISASSVPVTTALTRLVGPIPIAEARDLSFEVFNQSGSTGTLNAFVLVRKMPGGNKTQLFAGTDWHTAGGLLKATSQVIAADGTMGTKATNYLNALTPGQSGFADLDVGGALEIELWASATAAALVDVNGAARPMF